MGNRESARIAWRSRVDAAARAMRGTERSLYDRNAVIIRTYPSTYGTMRELSWKLREALDAALAAPKPWRSQQRPDPRRRRSRAHRKTCQPCRSARALLVNVRQPGRVPTARGSVTDFGPRSAARDCYMQPHDWWSIQRLRRQWHPRD